MQEEINYSHHYNGFVTKKGNYVWAGAMCLAWNQLILSYVKEPIKLATQNKQVVQVIQNFNSAKFKPTQINPKSIYIKSGMGQETVNLINKQVRQKFPQKTMKDLTLKLQKDDIISYAYLFKKLQFKTKFQKFPNNNFLFNDKECPSFYTNSKQTRKQISYCSYQNQDNFVISISSKNPDDLIFFVKSQKQLTVQEVITASNEDKLKIIDKGDFFQMPIVQIQADRSINQLKLPFLNKSMQGYTITQIFQGLKLRIDQAGAKVQNQAVIVASRCMAFLPQDPKRFILNKSFWVCMKQKNRHPYLCAYIINPSDK